MDELHEKLDQLVWFDISDTEPLHSTVIWQNGYTIVDHTRSLILDRIRRPLWIVEERIASEVNRVL